MKNYDCLIVRPGSLNGPEPVAAESPEEAVIKFHMSMPDSYSYKFRHEFDNGKLELLFFARIRVREIFREEHPNEPVRYRYEDRGELISKVIKNGIWRRGGVKVAKDNVKDLAARLGWEHPAHDLLAKWEGEESLEEALAKRAK